jgi:hypothetical protein
MSSVWSPFREQVAAEEETWLSGLPPQPAAGDGLEFGAAEAELEDVREHPITMAFPLPAGVFEALGHGLTSVAIGLAAAAGYRDVDQLTNVVFYFRHSDMVGRRIRPDEHALAQEWLSIRDNVVKPALRSPAPASPPTAHPVTPPVSGAELSPALLQWPEANADQLAFMRAVYEAHARNSKASGRPFVGNLPKNALGTVDSFEARKDAAEACAQLLAEARAQLAADGLAGTARIGIVSAYRPATLQFQIWQGRMFDGTKRHGGFPYYYDEAIKEAIVRAGDFGPKAVEAFAQYLGKYIASPGYSNHQDGLAFDFGTGEVGKDLGAIGWRSWFRHWLEQNGKRLHFAPLPSEAWHWTYTPPAGAHELEFDYDLPTAAQIPAGRLEVAHVPLLAHHRGVGPDLVLRWNDIASAPSELDVVVHLHGFWYPHLSLTRDIEPVSGLDLVPIEGESGTGRTRPTLTVLPRGNDTGVKQPHGPYNAYTFPALVTRTGLPTLVDYAVGQFASATGGAAPQVGRLILTAHSGGGLALVEILERHDPHQVHVFDALYWSPDSLITWARRRIRNDRAAGASHDYMEKQGGALRVFYQGRVRGGTRPNSLAVLRALEHELVDGLDHWYRVEASNYDHFQIPRRYGWRVLADASADVPDAYREGSAPHTEVEEPETYGESEDTEYGLLEYDTPRDAGTDSGSGGHSGTTLTTVVEPFPSSPPALTFGSTIGGISAVTSHHNLDNLCCALADLTDNAANPPFVGVHDDEVLYVGSVQKVSAMYAAFELRKRVRMQVDTAKANGLNTTRHGWEVAVIDDLQRDWTPKLRSAFPPPLPESLPQFATIFEFESGGGVRFPRSLSDAELDDIAFPGTPKGAFGDWLYLMIHWSNDEASALCISALGFSYINGLLRAAGFMGGSPEHGLWLAGNYGGRDWLPHPPGHREINPAGRPLTKRWATAQDRPSSNMTATAQQLCRFFVLIDRDKLVGAAACAEMKTLLDSRSAAGSYLNKALDGAGRRADKQFSKLGIGNDVSYHDCGIVERRIGSGAAAKTIRYVVVGLGEKRTDKRDLKKLFTTLDDLIVARHP